MHKNMIRFQTLMLVGLAIFPQIAYAQTVDYSGLEQVFGEPVTTSATGQPQKVSDAPVNMEIITADDIRRSGAENIPQILGRLVGVVNWQLTRNSADIGIHGQNISINPSVLVLVNGRQVYSDIYGFTAWNSIPVQMEEIKQIEVVKGPNTALFGFNASAGVINIITYNPKYNKVGDAGVKVGTDGYRKLHFLDTFDLSDKASVRISGGMKQMQQFDNHSKTNFATADAESDPRFNSFNVDSLFQLSDKTQLRLEANNNNSETEIVAYYYPYKEDSRTYSGKATLSSATSLGLMEASLYRNDYKSLITTYGFDNEVTVAELKDTFRFGNDHTFRLSGEYRNNVARGAAVYGAGAEVGYDVYSAAAMWNWDITPKLSLTNALRYDAFAFGRTGPLADNILFPNGNGEFDENIDGISANSGLVWKATPVDNFDLSFGRGLQVASLIPLGEWANYLNLLILQANPHLQPTVVHNYEIGYDRKIHQIDGKFRTSLFYRQTKDIWYFYTKTYLIGSTPVMTNENIGQSSSVGIDAALSGKFAQYWSWDVNYAYQNANDDLTRSYDIQALNYQDTVPHHIANVHLGWAKGPWEVDGFVQAASDFQATSFIFLNQFTSYNIDHYFTSGGRIAYTFDDDITVALSGTDISQARVANNPGLENERQLFLSISKKF